MQHYSRDVLSFIFLVLTAVNLWKALRAYNKGPDLLNRQQTDEWKGWMQVRPLPSPPLLRPLPFQNSHASVGCSLAMDLVLAMHWTVS